MTFIHQHSKWPTFVWDSEALATILGKVRHAQGMLQGRMLNLGFDLRSEAHLEVVTTDIVKSSAIEGEMLDLQEVRSSVARRLGLDIAGLPRAGRYVDGIVEMMLDVTQHFDTPLTHERLSNWHAALFPTGRSGMRRITVGKWRTSESGPMQVVSGPIGHEEVHFEAPHAERLESEMTRFLEWFNEEETIDPVLKAGVAHLWFVTIHPFEDGNGRIARAIADLALARADGTSERFYSMSSQIERERNAYYQMLKSTQRGGLDITVWLTWFLECLDRAIQRAESTLLAVFHKACIWQHTERNPLNDRQRLVLNRLLDDFQGFLTTSKYAKLAKCSTDTALRDIRELLDYGILIQNPGRGRRTSYRLADEDGPE